MILDPIVLTNLLYQFGYLSSVLRTTEERVN